MTKFAKVQTALETLEAGSPNLSRFKEQNSNLNHAVESYISGLFDIHYLNVLRDNPDLANSFVAPHLTEAYYATRSLTGYKKLVRELNLAKGEFNVTPILDGVLLLEGMAERAKAAKAKVATPSQIREVKAVAKAKEVQRAQGNEIAACFNAQRAGFVADFEAHGEKVLAKLNDRLASGDAALEKKLKNDIVDGQVSPAFRIRYMDFIIEQANFQVDSFIAKMIGLIGDVEYAEIVSGYLWSFCVLRVTKNGERQIYETRRILNVSKYGKLFNQWPTRRTV